MINRRSFLMVTIGAAAMAGGSLRLLRRAEAEFAQGHHVFDDRCEGECAGKFRAMKEAGFEAVEPMGGMNREEVIAAFRETGLAAASACRRPQRCE